MTFKHLLTYIVDMKYAERCNAFLRHFLEKNAPAAIELDYNTPFQLLVAAVLSAQCTDKRVNQVTPALFAAYPTPRAMAQSSLERLHGYIRSISYPNSKSKYLLGIAQKLTELFDGQVPADTKALQKLPGVGRKTANVVASVIYGQPKMAVDTHVFRVSKRLGLVSPDCKTPRAVEQQLVERLPQAHLSEAHHWLVLHGRYICKARRPQCSKCGLTTMCRFFSEVQADDNGKA